ncbi:MAG: radical SAM protein [Candidatus Colwellbacteria bacterium]|nr:radical SAM protein [Candidatus Colwellbacteria bacterium]
MDYIRQNNPLSGISGPFIVNLELTGACPNDCIHCYNFWRHGKGLDEAGSFSSLSLADSDKIVDVLDDLKVFTLVITGGEPLLSKEVLFHILDRIEEKGFMTASLNSSLIGLTEDDADRLKKYDQLLNVLVSLNGSTPEMHDKISGRAGAFDETVKNIRLLVGKGIRVPISMVVSKLNIGDIAATCRLSKELGCSVFNATRASAPLNCPDFGEFSLGLSDFRSYLSDLTSAGKENDIPVGSLRVYPLCAVKDTDVYASSCGRSCSAGLTNIAISPNGDVRPCAQLDEVVGNIIKEPFTDIWESLSGWRDMKYVPQECLSCKALSRCSGGCRAEAKAIKGAIDSPDPLMHIEDSEYALEHIKERGYEKNRPNPVLISRVNPDFRAKKEVVGYVVFGYGRLVCSLDNRTGRTFFTEEGMPVLRHLDLGKLNAAFGTEFVSDVFGRRVLIPVSDKDV